MTEILYYGVKLVLTSGVLFLYYHLFLRDKTFHHYNRFYLLGSVLVSLLLPLLRVSYFIVQVNNENYLLLNLLQKGTAVNDHATYYPIIFAISVAFIAALLTGRFLSGIFKILKLKKRFSKEEFDGVDLYMTDLEDAPFSYFKNLFWKHTIPIDSGLGRQILQHEMVHIKQRHTYDKIFIEIIKSIFWFNPFFYMIKREIQLIHEYLADKKAVGHSDTKAFARMLLTSHFSENLSPATSPLLSASIRKRLKMLTTPEPKFSYARRAFALPVLFFIVFACVVHAQNKLPMKAIHFEPLQVVNKMEKAADIAEPGNVICAGEPGQRSIPIQQQNNAEIVQTGKHSSKQQAAPEIFAHNSEDLSNTTNEDNLNLTESRNKMVSYDAALSEEVHARIKHDAAQAAAAAAIARETANVVRRQAAIVRRQAEQVRALAKHQ